MCNNTTVASSASAELVHAGALTAALPTYAYRPALGADGRRNQSERVYLEAGQRATFRASTPSTAVNLSGTLKFREIGLT